MTGLASAGGFTLVSLGGFRVDGEAINDKRRWEGSDFRVASGGL